MNTGWKNESRVFGKSGDLFLIRRSGTLRRARGKELDRFNTLDFYDFEARAYDPVLMRFTRTDPMAEKYPGISPYAYCANNPVNRIDLDGREWKTRQDEVYAKKLSEKMTDIRNTKFTQAVNKFGDYKIALSKGDTEGAAKIVAEIKEMGKDISNLEAGVSELKAMGETTEQGFTYNMTGENVGYAGIDENGIIVMDIAGNGSISNGIHESSHGYDLWKDGITTKGNFLNRESKAYGREFSFGTAIPSSDWYKPIKNLSGINGSYVLGIRHNNEYIYGKIYHGNTYNYKSMQRAFRMARKGKW